MSRTPDAAGGKDVTVVQLWSNRGERGGPGSGVGRDVAWSGTAMLSGAFTGAPAHGSCRQWRVTIGEGALVAEDGAGDGRSLPWSLLANASVIDLPGRGSGLWLRWRDGDASGSLLVRPVFSLFGRRGAWPAKALAALVDAGVPVLEAAPPPMLSSPADEAWRALDDTILWSGRASLPSHPWFDPAPSHAWLTPRCLRWSQDGSGACRLPLDAIDAASPVDDGPGSAPAVAIAYRGPDRSRLQLDLRFDQHGGGDRDARERGAFLAALRSRGIAAPRRPGEDGQRRPAPVIPFRRPAEPAFPLARPSGLAAARANARRTPADLLGDARACEAALLDDLAHLNADLQQAAADPSRAERLGPPLGGALAAVEAAETAGAIDAEDAASLRGRLLALGEATTRLRALRDLRDAGHLAGADLDAKRRRILEPLAPHLAPDAP